MSPTVFIIVLQNGLYFTTLDRHSELIKGHILRFHRLEIEKKLQLQVVDNNDAEGNNEAEDDNGANTVNLS